MDCPAASEIERYLAGELAAAARAELDRHLDACGDCRRTVALLAQGLTRVASEASPALADTALGPAPGGEPDPSQPVGRYVLGERLGSGGMGVVYAAHDPELGRAVAIKLLRRGERAGGDARVLREARAMARISHPNVLAVHDAGTIAGQVFIAMELARGGTLRRWLAAAPRTVGEIVRAYSAAGRGLAAAHAAGLVHRDFKPDNVLCDDDGRIRVTDFGLAIAAQDSAGDESRAIAGTPSYMAPEQHQGGNVDARSDQFSFAVALYEALHGGRPFAATSHEGLLAAIEAGRIAPAPAGTRVPRSLRAILGRALAPVPGDRYPTMDALLRALGRDRARTPRRVAAGAAVALLVVAVALAADAIVGERAIAITRVGFEAARAQLGRLVDRRTSEFVATTDLLAATPIMREVASAVDQADFGLGPADQDRRQLAYVHDNLRSAEWGGFLKTQGAELAIADYKGRLLYASADPSHWATDVRRLPAIAAGCRRADSTPYAAVLRGDDPALLASGVIGPAHHDGLEVLLARTIVVDRPRAVFVQVVAGERLLGEVSLGEGIELSLVGPDGTAEGTVPAALLAARPAAGAVAERTYGGDTWLVEAQPLVSPGSGQVIAQIVLARAVGVGLAGMFPGARRLFSLLALGLVGIGLGALALARRRDLSRASRPPGRGGYS